MVWACWLWVASSMGFVSGSRRRRFRCTWSRLRRRRRGDPLLSFSNGRLNGGSSLCTSWDTVEYPTSCFSYDSSRDYLVGADLSSGCSFIAGTNSFRTAWAIQFVPCVFLLAGLPFLPRSPRWLAKVGRVDEAIEILARIQAGGDVNDPLVVAEWEEITTILAAERGKRFSDLTVHAHLRWWTSRTRSMFLLEPIPSPIAINHH